MCVPSARPEISSLSSLSALTVTDLAARVRRKEVSAHQVISAALQKIAVQDATLHSFVTLCADEALAAAARVDACISAGDEPGPLAGVPIGIKDLLSTAGLRTTFGSVHYADHVPDQDDIAVARLRAAGAIVLGKTNTSEFGYGAIPRNRLFPATRNPWNPDLGPGGSSAGSAAAVASGMVPLALGSDGGGSIRVPAALTGLVGFKPSWGRVPVYPGCRDERMPGASGWESLEHIGPMTLSVADARLAYSVMLGPDPRDRHSLPIDAAKERVPIQALRIAFSPDLGFASVDPEVAAICATAVRVFVDLGAEVETDDPGIGDVQELFETIVALDTDRSGLVQMRSRTGIGFDPVLTALLEQEWTGERFEAALRGRKHLTRQMSAFFARWDILATPTMAAAAIPIGQDHPQIIAGRPANAAMFTPFSAVANLTGQPAISIPAGLTADGRPVGLQLVGRHLADGVLLDAAEAFEAVRPFPRLLDKSPSDSQS